MPPAVVQKWAKESGMSKKDAEHRWDIARQQAKKAGRDPEITGKQEDWKYVMGIFKKAMKHESAGDLILRVVEGEPAADVVRSFLEKQESYKVSREFYQRAMDRIANLERRGVDVEEHTLLRLERTNNPGKIQGIWQAAQELGMSKVAKAAAKKFKEIVGQPVRKF